MHRWRTLGLVIALYCCVSPARARAYVLPVIDGANLLQSTLTTLQTTYIVANQILDLAAVTEMVLGEGYTDQLITLGGIVWTAQGLSYDIEELQQQITSLFDLATAPRSASALEQRLGEARKVINDCYRTAMTAQALVRTTLRTVRHLRDLVGAIGKLTGNMQANQTTLQMEAQLTQLVAQLQVQTGTFERAQSVERMTESITIESIRLINREIMLDHPR